MLQRLPHRSLTFVGLPLAICCVLLAFAVIIHREHVVIGSAASTIQEAPQTKPTASAFEPVATQPGAVRLSAPPDIHQRAVEAAMKLPSGKNRETALHAAVANWILVDPAGVGAWSVRHLHDTAEFDRVAAMIVTQTDTVNRSTQVALSWAGDIADPVLRRRALIHVLREWTEQDPVAARSYVEQSPTLSPAERAQLLSAITPFPQES